jgi:hypothetical protein
MAGLTSAALFIKWLTLFVILAEAAPAGEVFAVQVLLDFQNVRKSL